MMRNGVGQLIQTTRGRGDSIKPVVDAWLAKVETVRYEAMGLNGEAEQIKGWYCARSHLGKEARENVGTENELLDEGRGFSSSSTVSDPVFLPSIETSPTEDFQQFASRESATKKIVNALKDEKINMVGVYGMGGLGKTTLIEEIRKNVKRDQLFDEAIVVAVSQKADLKKVTDDITANLGVKLEEGIETVRARWLSMRLKDKNCVLVILDDLRERLNLVHVVIRLGDDQKGCKVVITTRSPDVRNQMETQMKIELKVLSKSDSWNLFWQKACDVVGSPLQTLAREVAKECGSFPLALVTLGRALRDKDQNVWEDGARQLKNSIFEGMSPIIASIKLSCDYLEDEEMKRCFLVCCIFPEDWNCKEDLMWYVMGEELLRNVDTLEEARGRLHTLREKVEASCLLLKGDKDGCVKIMMLFVMHHYQLHLRKAMVLL